MEEASRLRKTSILAAGKTSILAGENFDFGWRSASVPQ
jgi:hypothetical protein